MKLNLVPFRARLRGRRLSIWSAYLVLLYVFFHNLFLQIYNIFNKISEHNINLLENVIRQRTAELESTCPTDENSAAQNPQVPQANLYNYQIDMKYKLLGCIPDGVRVNMGWTFLFYNIRQLDRELNNYDRESFVESLLASRENATEWKNVNKNEANYMKFIMVRHPLARLYEAWEVLYAKPLDSNQQQKFGMHSQGRKGLSSLDKSANGISLYKQDKNPDWSTFLSDFADNIELNNGKNRNKIDEHFTPIDKHCQLCQAPIDLILKIETINDDYQVFNYILKNRLRPEIFNEIKETLNIKHKYYSLSEISKFYTSNIISKEKLRVILKYYKRDMNLLGYYMDIETGELGSLWPT